LRGAQPTAPAAPAILDSATPMIEPVPKQRVADEQCNHQTRAKTVEKAVPKQRVEFKEAPPSESNAQAPITRASKHI
jgi:hypothetical protein